MNYKLIGVIEKERKIRTYQRRCRICSQLYRTESKGSAICSDCKCNNNRARTCPKCGKTKQFGDKMEVCADCRDNVKVYWRRKRTMRFEVLE